MKVLLESLTPSVFDLLGRETKVATFTPSLHNFEV